MTRGAGSDRGRTEMSEMKWLAWFRTWVTWAMQSGFQLFSFSLGIGLLSGVVWGSLMWFAWNMTAWLAPHRGISLERLNSREGIIVIAEPSLGFGLTTAGLVWLFLLLPKRLAERPNGSPHQFKSGHDRMTDIKKPEAETPKPEVTKPVPPPEKPKKVEEIGGPPGPEPTRYGDWQFNGKVTDF